jgi:hypothetical protein
MSTWLKYGCTNTLFDVIVANDLQLSLMTIVQDTLLLCVYYDDGKGTNFQFIKRVG